MIDPNFLHNAIDEGDFTDDVCHGLLDALAEVEYLRAELAAVRAALPDADDLLVAARFAKEEIRHCGDSLESQLYYNQLASRLGAAAARIREVQC